MEFISDKIQTIKKILSSRKGLSSMEEAGDTFEFEYVWRILCCILIKIAKNRQMYDD